MTDYNKARAARIKQKVPLLQVLSDYGYEVTLDDERDQQFSCDLHGDGQDSKPSARAYESSDHWYCFACIKQRDVIQTVMEKEEVSFSNACFFLEKKYGLPTLRNYSKKEVVKFDTTRKREIKREDMEAYLIAATKERWLSLQDLLSLWETFDCANYYHSKGEINDKRYNAALHKIRNRANDMMSKK